MRRTGKDVAVITVWIGDGGPVRKTRKPRFRLALLLGVKKQSFVRGHTRRLSVVTHGIRLPLIHVETSLRESGQPPWASYKPCVCHPNSLDILES